MGTAVYTVGRFQPPTLGHIRMIDEMLRVARGAPAFVFISSAKDSLLPSAMKEEYLRKMLTRGGVFPANLTLVDSAKCDPACGGPLGGWGYLKDRGFVGSNVLLVVGSDQGPKFDPKSAPMWKSIPEEERPSIYVIERSGPGAATFSSTKARQALATGQSIAPFLTDGTNAITPADVERMASALLAVRAKWPKPKGGRKTRRSTKSKASGRALYRRGLRSRSGSSRTSRF